MAKLKVLNDPLDILNYDLDTIIDGDITQASSKTVRLDLGGGDYALFKGQGFSYNLAGIPNDGTLKKVEVQTGGDLDFKLSKGNIDLKKFYNFIDSGKDTKALKHIFREDDKIIGSEFDDVLAGFKGNDDIKGKAGDDTLDGGKNEDDLEGGLGSDVLIGGKHKDNYIFRDAPDGSVDTIQKFESGETISVDGDAFADIGGKGTLKKKYFVNGTEAGDSNDRFVYNMDTGELGFDGDGSGAGAIMVFAKLTPGTSLSNDDIMVI